MLNGCNSAARISTTSRCWEIVRRRWIIVAELVEGLYTSLRTPQYQSVYIVRTLVGIHSLQIAHMAENRELV